MLRQPIPDLFAIAGVDHHPKFRRLLFRVLNSINQDVIQGATFVICHQGIPDATILEVVNTSRKQPIKPSCCRLADEFEPPHMRNIEQGRGDDYESVLADVQRRDHADSTRAVSPLRPAEDSVIVDTSELDLDGVIERLLLVVNDRSGAVQ